MYIFYLVKKRALGFFLTSTTANSGLYGLVWVPLGLRSSICLRVPIKGSISLLYCCDEFVVIYIYIYKC